VDCRSVAIVRLDLDDVANIGHESVPKRLDAVPLAFVVDLETRLVVLKQ
jgi:hypothetical protein